MISNIEIGTILIATRNVKWDDGGFRIVTEMGKRYKVTAFYSKTFVTVDESGNESSQFYTALDTESSDCCFITLKEQRKAKLESIL